LSGYSALDAKTLLAIVSDEEVDCKVMCLMLSAALSEEGRGEEENKEGVYLYQEILQGLIDGLIRYEGRGTAKFLAASTVLEYDG